MDTDIYMTVSDLLQMCAQLEAEGPISDTASFESAIDSGNTAQAEQWMLENYGKKEGYDDRWRDHREADLYHYFRNKGDMTNTQRVAEMSIKSSSRKKRLADLKRRKAA